MEDFASIAGIEFICINNETRMYQFKNELRWNDKFYQ
jgi:L-arabinose isomerase